MQLICRGFILSMNSSIIQEPRFFRPAAFVRTISVQLCDRTDYLDLLLSPSPHVSHADRLYSIGFNAFAPFDLSRCGVSVRHRRNLRAIVAAPSLPTSTIVLSSSSRLPHDRLVSLHLRHHQYRHRSSFTVALKGPTTCPALRSRLSHHYDCRGLSPALSRAVALLGNMKGILGSQKWRTKLKLSVLLVKVVLLLGVDVLDKKSVA